MFFICLVVKVVIFIISFSILLVIIGQITGGMYSGNVLANKQKIMINCVLLMVAAFFLCLPDSVIFDK